MWVIYVCILLIIQTNTIYSNVNKRNTKEAADNIFEDEQVAEYLRSLSQSDQELLRRMRSKAVYLKSAIQASASSDNIPDDELATVDRFIQKRIHEDPTFEHLTEKEMELIEKYASKIEQVKTLFHEKGSEDSVQEKPPSEVRWQRSGSILEDVDLTPEEVEVLKKVKEKVHQAYLNKQKNGDEQWGQHEVTPNDEGQRQVRGCSQGCSGFNNKEDALEEVTRRFIEDMQLAQKHGLTLKDLMGALNAKKRSLMENDEEQLGTLAKH